ncbi:MAG: ABC transporter ATP-binding protein [Candidatus Hodarchaeota archaeon]
MALLEIKSVAKNFGGLKALSNITVNVGKGEFVALIGPNGAGKTTLFNLISRLLDLTSGEIIFEGKLLNKLNSWDIAKLGIARTFQLIGTIGDVSVLENVLLGTEVLMDKRFLPFILRSPRTRNEERRALEKSKEILAFIGLENRMHEKANVLPFGELRLLEIARAIVIEPKLLLLDESFSGLTIGESKLLENKLREIHSKGITIFFIEHEMRVVRNLAQKIYVLNFGEILTQGSPEEVISDERVLEAYLGRYQDDIGD